MPYARMKNELPLIPGYSEGAIAYAPDAATAPLNECICYINPVQDLHGQDYPYPSGGGKNKLDFESWLTSKGVSFTKNGNSYTFNVSSLVGSSGAWTFSDTPISVTLSSNITNKTSTNVGFRLRNGSDISSRGENLTYTATEIYLDWSTTGQVTIEEPMIRLSSVTDPTYAPYSNICPITGHTELNLVQKDGNDTVVHTYTTDLGTTVYGGMLDVETGVLTKKYEKYKLGSTGWIENSGRYQHRYEGIMKSGSYYSDKGAICDTYPKLETLASGTGLVLGYNSDFLYFYVKDDFPTLADWTTYLENNDVYVTMPIATPTTTQLTPQEVKSLLGSNNFYHDCNGDTKITYIRRLDS